jgi:preprotein translocase subunit SecB
MSLSSLQLERYFFVKVNVQAHERGPGDSSGKFSTKLEVSRNNNDSTRYLVGLTVTLAAEEGKLASYYGEVVVMGLFHVSMSPGMSDLQKVEELVSVNGASILYGVIREMVANVTSRGPWPPVLLPCVNFLGTNQSQKTGGVFGLPQSEL